MNACWADHPDTLGSVSNLAVLLLEQGNHVAAELLCRRALEGFKKVYGPDHPRARAIEVALSDITRNNPARSVQPQ